jgi:acetyltransferase-like isoleucine patch superfamily enzyme
MISARYLTACQIPFPAKVGQYNEVGCGVQFLSFKDTCPGPVEIGDCNRIEDGTRILVGPGGFKMGDYNVIHNHCTIGGPGAFEMGHNCWFGQEVWLDSTGDLSLGNGVRVGVRSHIWSHMASGEQIEGWKVVFRPTRLEDDVWLVGDDVHVASGVTMAARSAAMAHSTVTRDTLPDRVYAGTPAREVSFRLRRDVTLDETMKMMWGWADDFLRVQTEPMRLSGSDEFSFRLSRGDYSIIVLRDGAIPLWQNDAETTSVFELTYKTYIKRLTQLERDFVRFLYGNKARFLPAGESV